MIHAIKSQIDTITFHFDLAKVACIALSPKYDNTSCGSAVSTSVYLLGSDAPINLELTTDDADKFLKAWTTRVTN